jgi:opacity protein-like surface antigen
MITHKAKASLAAALLTLAALPAQAQDWTGAYVGASASSHSGTNTEYWDGVLISPQEYTNPFTRSGTMRNLFAGYRIQNDAIVYGAEISRSTGALRMPEPFTKNNTSDYTTLMGKIGYAQDNVLYSAGLGYFQGTINAAGVEYGTSDISGAAMSLGVDVLVTDNVTIGTAVTRRTFGKAGYSGVPDSYESEGNDTAVELRVGYNF